MCYNLVFGAGVNSVALAIEIVKRGLPLDHILFSDTLGEKPETYQYIDTFSTWLLANSAPPVTRLQPYRPEGLYGECIRLKRLPSIVYGFKSCSEKWKRRPYVRFCNENSLWPVTTYKGYDAGEAYRVKQYSDHRETVEHPLVDWDFDRMDCVKIIIDAGLPLPPKSSCFFCPSMKRDEIYNLQRQAPAQFAAALRMEDNAKPNLRTVKGLARDHSWKVITSQLRMDFDTPVKECSECHI